MQAASEKADDALDEVLRLMLSIYIYTHIHERESLRAGSISKWQPECLALHAGRAHISWQNLISTVTKSKN